MAIKRWSIVNGVCEKVKKKRSNGFIAVMILACLGRSEYQ